MEYTNKVYLIITSCINNHSGIINYQERKDRYIMCINNVKNIIKDYNIIPVIVENNGKRVTYLDELGIPIIYTNNNKYSRHKGCNEALDIKHVINVLNCDDNDIIIKLTGRYKLLDDSFIKDILTNIEYDAYIKFFNVCTLEYMQNDCVLGLFAIKCKYLKEYSFTYEDSIRNPSTEVSFATYVRKNCKKIKEYTYLGLECLFADNNHLLTV